MRYHCISVLSILAALLFDCFATPLSPRWDDMHTKHSWNAVPKNWESLGHPPSGTTIDLHVALKPHRDNALLDALHEVSNPRHPKYGEHLSKEQVAELVAPHPDTLQLVNSWLEHRGVPSSSVSLTHGGHTLMLKGVSVTQANALLGASYQLYRHVERNETIVRTVGYALPAELHSHVLTVAPTTSFVSPPTWHTPRNRFSGAAAGSGEPAAVLSSRNDVNYLTPTFLRWLYYTSAYIPAAPGRNVLGIVGLLGDFPSPADLATYLRKFRSGAADATISVVQVNGGRYDPGDPTMEANLDIQYTESLTYPTPHIYYSTGRGPWGTDDWFISWLGYIVWQRSIPQTISMSYGQDEGYSSKEYSEYVCDLFMQLGARGVSVLVGSGDDGVGRGKCVTNDNSVRFSPMFPATCPWVTAVGGTTGYEPEVAATFSGGGFSYYFPRPDYQEGAVSTFLRAHGTWYEGLYDPMGRGIPDISAQAIGFPVFFNGIEKVVSGTSGSTPIVAAIISLLNDYRISKGQAPLGFLNLWLYGSGSEALFDITSGSNPGCGTPGFSAIDGWDPVTGLGTPDFGDMQEKLPVSNPPGTSQGFSV